MFTFIELAPEYNRLRYRQVILLALCFSVALSLSIWLVSPLHAQTPTIEQAAEQLELAAEALEQGNIEQARRFLDELDVIALDDDTQMILANDGWAVHLQENQPEVASLLRQAAHNLRHPPATLPPDARQKLDEVLARPDFQPAQPTLWQRMVDWLLDQLPDVSQMEGSDLIGNLLIWFLVALSLLLIGGVLFSFLLGLRRTILRQEVIEELEGDIPLYASQAQEQATEAAKSGEFREAMRLLYLAALLHLDEVGLIRFDRALTNQEVLAEVGNNEQLNALLTPVVTLFDRVWYGHAPFGEVEFQQASRQIEQLRTLEASE